MIIYSKGKLTLLHRRIIDDSFVLSSLRPAHEGVHVLCDNVHHMCVCVCGQPRPPAKAGTFLTVLLPRTSGAS